MEMFIGRPDDSKACNLGDIVNSVYGIKIISGDSPIDDLLDVYNDYQALYRQFGDIDYKNRMDALRALFKSRTAT